MTDSAAYEIAVLPGDGIGPEVIDAAVTVLDAAARSHGVTVDCTFHEGGAKVFRASGESISADTMARIGTADAILLGAAGLPDVRAADGTESALPIDIREHYGLFASLRPARLFPGVRSRVRAEQVNMLVIRETTEGLFSGRRDPVIDGGDSVSDRLTISRGACERLFTLAFEQARTRRDGEGTPGHVTLFDKANVLPSNAFMRSIFDEVAADHPDIATDRVHIDAGCMLLVTRPERFDVVVTENSYGDIASEVAAGVVGGLGVAPSGDVSRERGVFQPSHGSAPDIVGTGTANPIATILSVGMMLEWLAERHGDDRARAGGLAVRDAVAAVLADGPRTPDLGGAGSTQEVRDAVWARLVRAGG